MASLKWDGKLTAVAENIHISYNNAFDSVSHFETGFDTGYHYLSISTYAARYV